MRTLHFQCHRKGFTLIEVLVVISIISVLMALILPAIQSARSSARRAQCQNRMKNVAIGMNGYVSAHKGKYPSVLSPRDGGIETWAVQLMPYMDAQAIHDILDVTDPLDATIPGYLCPEDSANAQQTRGLSFVVNVGYGLATDCFPGYVHRDTFTTALPAGAVAAEVRTRQRKDGLDGFELTVIIATAQTVVDSYRDRLIGLDWNKDGKVTTTEDQVTMATGVFWSGNTPRNERFTSSNLDNNDGTSNTLMISERNMRRDWATPPSQGSDYPFTSLYPLRFLGPVASHGFGMSTNSFRTIAGQHTMQKEGVWIPQPSPNQLRYSRIMTEGRYDACPPFIPKDSPQAINVGSSGYYLPPTSLHRGGGVNVAFCDGRVSFLSELIAPSVFAQLLSSGGQRYGQGTLSHNSF